jgi:DNA recombination protein RmuC
LTPLTILGIFILGSIGGFLASRLAGKSEREALREKSTLLGQQNASLIEQNQRQSQDATELRQQLEAARTELDRRSGFERLAEERAQALNQTATELAQLRTQAAAELARTRTQAAAELTQARAEAGAEQAQIRGQLAAKTEAEAQARAQISRLESELKSERAGLQEKVALLESSKKALSDQFEALAGKILEEKSKSFSEATQKDLGGVLQPLRSQIDDFRKKVEEAQSDSKTSTAKLEGLIGSLGSLNQQLAAEANNLATALRGSAKAQGDWGEFILRDLLEKAGLREGEQYSFQQVFTGVQVEGEKEKTARTDVILLLPGGRNLVVDSKVSLTAYTDFTNAPSEEVRKTALKQHLVSIRGHIAEIAKSGYHRLPGIEAPDFVVMFVPIEPAFMMALQADADLWSDAYKQGILLVGPTTLLYVIRIVEVLWKQEAQARNVRDVMERGTALYEKFVGFVSDLEAVGKGLRTVDSNYNNAMKKLAQGPGNLVRQVEMLKELGVRSSKSLPKTLLDQAEEPVLELAAVAEENENA